MGFGSGPSLGATLLGEGAAGHVVERARAAERAGFDDLWFIEDYFQTGAFTMAGAAAAVTTRIGLGLGVVDPYTRHPALLAMETATMPRPPSCKVEVITSVHCGRSSMESARFQETSMVECPALFSCNSRGVPMAMMRPASIMATRSHSRSASSM